MDLNTIYCGDCLEILRTLPSKSVNCGVTSPPYFGLRDYGVSGQIGLEETTEEYINKLVLVFREFKRVLMDDGTLWLNIGDSYSVGSNFADCFNRIVERGPFFIRDAATVGITSKSSYISLDDKLPPNSIFFSLFGIERILIKQRDNDFCQIIYSFANPSYCWVGCPTLSASRNISDLEIVLDSGYDISIIISEHDPNREPKLGINGIGARSGEDYDTPLPIEKAGKPISKSTINGQSARDSLFCDATLKRLPNIYLVNQSVALGNGFNPCPSDDRNFKIAKATREQIDLSFSDFGVNLTFTCVSHFYASNKYGSLISYNQLYHETEQKANENKAKQELGIPEMVKRALMQDGWICRQTIIWAKPNPMPESVTDRCTKSHEYIFLLSKLPHYYFDAEAIAESVAISTVQRLSQDIDSQKGSDRVPGKSNGNMKASAPRYGGDKYTLNPDLFYRTKSGNAYELRDKRNKRDVWTISTTPFKGAHFATFPEELITPCILAGCPAGGVVLDMFFGSGTTGLVALKNFRNYIGIELNPEYVKMADGRLSPYKEQADIFAYGVERR